MIRTILLMLALLLGPAIAHAQPKQNAKPAPTPETPALWIVQHGKSTTYLFGSVHTLPRGVDWFKPHIAKALDSSDKLVLEAVIPEDPVALQSIFLRLGRLQQERPLTQRVPQSWHPTLTRALERLKPGPLNWYKSWMVALTLSNLQLQANGIDPRIGVEAVLSERARMRNIPIAGLETVEQQLIYFDSLSEADQIQLLLSTLEELEQSGDQASRMIDNWLQGNTAALADQVNNGFERSPMLRRLLVDERNQRWAEWIEKQMKADPGPIFVAVGAGHMAGKGSLIEALEKRGLKVQPVMPEAPPRKKSRKR